MENVYKPYEVFAITRPGWHLEHLGTFQTHSAEHAITWARGEVDDHYDHYDFVAFDWCGEETPTVNDVKGNEISNDHTLFPELYDRKGRALDEPKKKQKKKRKGKGFESMSRKELIRECDKLASISAGLLIARMADRQTEDGNVTRIENMLEEIESMRAKL